MDQDQQRKCSISFCNQMAKFMCQRCQSAFYCNNNHQRLHWRSGHKIQCLSPSDKQKLRIKLQKQEKQNSIQYKRRVFRKSFVNSYATSKIEDYLSLTSILEDAEHQNLEKTKKANYQDIFNYGFTVCLLIKSLYLLGKTRQAKSKVTQYFNNNKDFLSQVDSYKQYPELKDITFAQLLVFMEKKMQLISILANLSYSLGMNYNLLYTIYATHFQQFQLIEKDNPQLSNVYFLLGCSYAQQGFPIKAISCFYRCSQLRSEDETQFKYDDQDSNYNMAILFLWLKKTNMAIVYFNKSLQSRQSQFGQNSKQVAEVYKNLATVFLCQFDFHTADYYYGRAWQVIVGIIGEDRTNPLYQSLQQNILTYFRKLCAYINNEPSDSERPERFISLRQSLLSNKKFSIDILRKFKKIVSGDQFKIPYTWLHQFKQRKEAIVFKPQIQTFKKLTFEPNSLIKWQFPADTSQHSWKKTKKTTTQNSSKSFDINISKQLMKLLSSKQLIKLSEAQQRLSYVTIEKRALIQIQNSQFIASLDQIQRQLFIKDNQKLYSNKNSINPQEFTFNKSNHVQSNLYKITKQSSDKAFFLKRKQISL